MNICSLSSVEIANKCVAPVSFSENYTQEDFAFEWVVVRDNIRDSIPKKWKEYWLGEGDYLLSDDYTNNWLIVGGIYTPNSLSFDFLRALRQSLTEADMSKWRFHFAIELWMTSNASSFPSGELLFHENTLYLPGDDKFPYKQFFA